MTTSHAYKYEERLLTVKNVCVTYEKPILRDVSFNIDNVVRPGMSQGQIISLLGPSGMGKSQLFRCIAGLQKPTSGSITMFDSVTPVKAGDAGVVLQHYPLLQHRTVLGNLNLVTKDSNKALTFLERFGLIDKKDLYPIQLSGGQRQRVAIIQQLLCSSHFVLLDEPVSGLDPVAKSEVIKLISEISMLDEANTIIMVTHDIESAMLCSDTILMLGRDHDVNGTPIPGARIQKTIDMIERDLCWHADIETRSNFIPTLREIKETFKTL